MYNVPEQQPSLTRYYYQREAQKLTKLAGRLEALHPLTDSEDILGILEDLEGYSRRLADEVNEKTYGN